MLGLGNTMLAAVSLLSLLILSGSGCRSASPGSSSTAATAVPASGSAATSTPTPPAVRGPLTVYAAASLTDAFRQIGANIEQANPATKLMFNFAGSPTLRTQLAQGARADVFASADQANMQGAQQDGTIAPEPQVFARNRLVIIVPAAGSRVRNGPEDLAKPRVKLVLTQENVPAGNYARQAFAKMSQDPSFGSDFSTKVLRNLVSQELDVKAVVAKIQLGEADAGVVYATDVTPSLRDTVKVLPIPDRFNVIAQYPIGVVRDAANPAAAQAFVSYLLSPAGQSVLQSWGFIPADG